MLCFVRYVFYVTTGGIPQGQIYLNSHTGQTLRDGIYLFPTDWNLCLSTRKPEPRRRC